MVNGFSRSNAFINRKFRYNPYFSAGFNFHEIFNHYYYGIARTINYLKLRASWGYNNSEVPSIFSLGSYNYQQYSSGQYTQAYFSNEVLSGYSLNPEKVCKKNIGLDFGCFSNRINGTFDYYQNRTTGCIVPFFENNIVTLKNLANAITNGYDATISFNSWFSYQWYTTLRMVISHNRNVVTDLYDNQAEIPLGGYTDVHTALVKGQPYGAIVGTTYQRNSNGELIIGTDGYPLLDSKLKVLDDPNPNYRIGMEFTLSHKAFALNCLVEFSKGGKVWNGTENNLSYLGIAQKTVDSRNINGFIYPGVTENGMPNSVPVNFADPSLTLDANRWVKYGPSGVAEDAIQDATWFRIRELCISYKVRSFHRKLPIEFSLFAKNFLLLTKYAGVDPETTLWGQGNTRGLDMFNMPNLKTYGLAIKISI
jgi:hypothetical protein